MHTLTVLEQSALIDMFWSIVALGLMLSFFLFWIFQSFFRFVFRKINFPQRVRTEHGYLYRTLTGLYVSKQRCLEIDTDLKLKRKDCAIKHHEYVLNRLKTSHFDTGSIKFDPVDFDKRD